MDVTFTVTISPQPGLSVSTCVACICCLPYVGQVSFCRQDPVGDRRAQCQLILEEKNLTSRDQTMIPAMTKKWVPGGSGWWGAERGGRHT